MIVDFIKNLGEYASSHGVNPLIFLAIYFGSTPFILIPTYKLARIAIGKDGNRSKFISLLTILASGWLAPYLYILIAGRGVSYSILIGVLAIGIVTLIVHIRKKILSKVVSETD